MKLNSVKRDIGHASYLNRFMDSVDWQIYNKVLIETEEKIDDISGFNIRFAIKAKLRGFG